MRKRAHLTLLFVGTLLLVGCTSDSPLKAIQPTLPTVAVVRDCPDCPEMVVIPAGTFTMGSPAGEGLQQAREGPQRNVSVKSFLLSRTEITQGQWKAVLAFNPSRFKYCGDDCPVESLSFHTAMRYVEILSLLTGKKYRLPSEAEWEYAARAGSATRWGFGDNEALLGQHAWFSGNSAGKTHAVASKLPNAFGLYDMHGNVEEWTADAWHDNYIDAPTDGSARGHETYPSRILTIMLWNQVLRGGSWQHSPLFLRSASRGATNPGDTGSTYGFRVARDL